MTHQRGAIGVDSSTCASLGGRGGWGLQHEALNAEWQWKSLLAASPQPLFLDTAVALLDLHLGPLAATLLQGEVGTQPERTRLEKPRLFLLVNYIPKFRKLAQTTIVLKSPGFPKCAPYNIPCQFSKFSVELIISECVILHTIVILHCVCQLGNART